MSREPENRAARPRSVGSAGNPAGKNTWFILGIVAVALSVAVLLTVVARAIASDDNGDTPANPGDPTASASAQPTATTEPKDDPSATTETPAMATATTAPATPTTTVDGFPLINCLDRFAPADKKHIMAPDCEPPDLVPIPNSGEIMRTEAAEALNEMFEAAADDGHTLLAVSGYRSYHTQEAVYASAVAGFGQEWADRTSARPGHSEHQLGTVMDVSTPSEGGELEQSFGTTPAGLWVKENSWRYGFIISYPEGTEEITGYTYEPWHLRYLGTDAAAEIHSLGITITEYLAQR